MKPAAAFLDHLLVDQPDTWHPLLAVYYLTYSCRFRCPYCSDGAGTPYYRLPLATLAAPQVLELLGRIRRHCSYLVLTGGEPLEHPEFGRVLEGLPALRFKGIILTTNGSALEPFLPALADSVHYLVFSLQTLKPERADAWYGSGHGVHSRVLENLDRAVRYPARPYKVVISSVVTPSNIGDLYEVFAYARQRGIRLAACPQLLGVKAHPALAGSAAYRRFYDFLIAEKRKGADIQGTVDYLEHMRDLRKFTCHPFTMLTVAPSGDVFYPCLELGQVAGSLLAEDSLDELRRRGRARFGPQPECDTRCHSACALGFSRLLENAASLLHEGALLARARLRQFFPAAWRD